MILFPAIDLDGGRVVRLEGGDFDRPTDYGGDPLETARRFRDCGATHLHVVDLQGAREGAPRHLKVLERAGLVSRGREAQWRPRRLDGAPLGEAAAWLEDYRRFWDESLDRLDEYLRRMKEGEADDAGKG